MPDREKVIKGLEFCTDQRIVDTCYGECPYAVADDEYKCLQMKLDALELLKEQEPVTIKKTKEHGFGVYGGICPKCHNWIQSAHSFCGFCGQAVKWE